MSGGVSFAPPGRFDPRPFGAGPSPRHSLAPRSRPRNPGKAALLRALGADPVVLGGLDAVAVGDAVARAEPEVVIHQMTALAGAVDLRRRLHPPG
jgi:hypothetical protein